MILFTDFPLELGQEFRYKTVENFKRLVHQYSLQKREFENHKTEEEHAHNAKQIDYENTNVYKELKYQAGRVSGLVVGHNGNGIEEVKDSRADMDGGDHDLLSERLKYDFEKVNKTIEDNYIKLNDKIERIVNVNDYGADPTGQEYSDQAFKDAFGTGGHHVHMTEGTYKIKNGLRLPSNTYLSGEGKDITIIKLSDDSPRETVAVTNMDMDGTAHNIAVESFTIEGNKETRFPGEKTTSENAEYSYPEPSGGSRSSNLRFAGVKYGYAYDIKSVNAMLHGIDITYASDDYFYEGDGVRVDESLESKFIHIDNCEVSGFGDDGITTHHSRYLNLTNNYAHDPKNFHGNSNGFEIDDGSQHVKLSGNTSENNYSALEIKAHGTSSAANNVLVDNHTSIHDCRAYNFRHIGHHRVATDKPSKTAHNIVLNNSTAIEPIYNKVYPTYSPRALVISAYNNVHINNFTAIGNGSFQSGVPAIAVQFMAKNIHLNNINVEGFKSAYADIQIFGGDNRPKKVSLSNINIQNSSTTVGIAIGGKIYDTSIIGANMIGTGVGTGVTSYSNSNSYIGVQVEGYKLAANIGGKEYKVMPTTVKGGTSIGSTGSAATAQRSAVIASTGNTFATSDRSWTLGAGMNSVARGSRSGVMNSLESETRDGNHTQLIINSRGVMPEDNYSTVWGYGLGGPKAENTSVRIRTVSGNIASKGTIQAGQNFGDYAEYFESQSGQAIPNGYIVTVDNSGRFIRKANQGDTPIGVISGTAGVILGNQLFHHKDKFLKDEFGVTLTEEVEKSYTDDEGNEYYEKVEMPIPNPDWKESDEEYEDRSKRPEWCVVGLMGQVFTRIDSTVTVGSKIKSKGGVATASTDGYYKVLEITTPYDSNKGYGVAVVLVK